MLYVLYFNHMFLLFFYRWKRHASGNVSLSLTIFFYNMYYSIKFFLKTFDFLFYESFLFSCWAVQFWNIFLCANLIKMNGILCHAWRNALISYGVQHHKIKLGELKLWCYSQLSMLFNIKQSSNVCKTGIIFSILFLWKYVYINKDLFWIFITCGGINDVHNI